MQQAISNFEIDHRARRCFLSSIPPAWTASPPMDDVGLDYWVQVTDGGRPTGIGFFVQLKGTTRQSQYAGSNAISTPISTARLQQYLTCPIPVLLVICSVCEIPSGDTVYSCWVRDYVRDFLDQRGASRNWWTSQETVLVTLGSSSLLTPVRCDDELLCYLTQQHKRMTAVEERFLARFARSQPNSDYINNWATYLGSNGIDPDSHVGRLLMQHLAAGRVLHAEGRLSEAVAAYTAVHALLPTRDVALELANCHSEQGEHLASLEVIERALEHHPNDPFLMSNKGTELFHLGQFEAAYSCHEVAVSLDPKQPYLLANAAATLEYIASGLRLERSDALLQRALALYERALVFSPFDDFILSEMGLVLTKMYDFRRAARVLETAISLNPRNVPALRRLVSAYVMLQNLPAAIELLDRLAGLGVETHYVTQMRRMLGGDPRKAAAPVSIE